MSVRTMPGTVPRNGLPPGRGYVYGGTGEDVQEPRLARPCGSRRGRQPGVPERVLAALRVLGGEASTSEIRAAVELDGGPAFHPGYLLQALNRLSHRKPPAVTAAGRERTGKGRAGRWHLGPGAGTAAGPAEARPVRRSAAIPAAPGDGHCRKCGCQATAPGHLATCGGIE